MFHFVIPYSTYFLYSSYVYKQQSKALENE